MRHLLKELKRRNVYKVAAAYLVAAFVVLQLAELAAGAFALPGWFEPMVWVLSGLGFPLALVLAWAFDLTAEGVERTPANDVRAEGPNPTDQHSRISRLAAQGLVAIGLLTGAMAGGWYLLGSGSGEVSERSVAVLPFETLGDTSSGAFTAGLHNDLISRLQRISGLKVIARPSVMRYEDTDQPLSRVAEELNAAWLITGAVQSAGSQVQVVPRLINPRDGTERWSKSYRRELSAEEVFDLQEEITRSIAASLETELAADEEDRVRRRPTEDLEAYRLYVRGRQLFAQRSGTCISCLDEAARLFNRAVERDSTFAAAWAGLADVAAVAVRAQLDLEADSLLPEPERAARRALELAPDLAEAHASLGHILLWNQDVPAAYRELRRAVELNPSYWEAHAWLGDLYWHLGMPEESLEHAELAVELNPQHAQARHGLYDAYNSTGQHQKSLEEARLQQRMGLEATGAVGGEVRALWKLGRLEEAKRIAREEIARDPDSGWANWFRVYLVGMLAEQGDTATARDYLGELRG